MSNMEVLDARPGEKARQRVCDAAVAMQTRRRLPRADEGLSIMFAWDALTREAV